MRISREQMFMDIAEVVAKRSACLRNNVGAVIVNEDNNIVAIGYNGVASGIPHCLQQDCHAGCDLAIHAEENAIRRMPWVPIPKTYNPVTGERTFGHYYRLFCTVSPCMNCANKIIDRGDINKVYYRYPYRDESGIYHLLKHNIKVYKILPGGIINEETL